MVYTNNVPQGSQQIATTQPIIQANFGFIQNSIGAEHNFNPAGSGTDTYHLKASMPNTPGSPALGSTNGVYFVNDGKAFFFDGTTNWRLNQWEGIFSGSLPFNTTSFVNIVAIPANSMGIIVLYRTSSVGYVQSGEFVTDNSKCYGYSNLMKLNALAANCVVELNNDSPNLNLQARAAPGFTGISYVYKIFYRPSPV